MNNQNTGNTQAGTNCIDSNSNNKGVREMPYNEKFVTQKSFDHFRSEMKSDLARMESNLKAFMKEMLVKIDLKFDKLDYRIDKLDYRMDKLEARMGKLEARMDKLEVRIDKLTSEVHEANRENKRTLSIIEQIKYEHSTLDDSIELHNRKILELEKNKADRSEIIKLDN